MAEAVAVAEAAAVAVAGKKVVAVTGKALDLADCEAVED